MLSPEKTSVGGVQAFRWGRVFQPKSTWRGERDDTGSLHGCREAGVQLPAGPPRSPGLDSTLRRVHPAETEGKVTRPLLGLDPALRGRLQGHSLAPREPTWQGHQARVTDASRHRLGASTGQAAGHPWQQSGQANRSAPRAQLLCSPALRAQRHRPCVTPAHAGT